MSEVLETYNMPISTLPLYVSKEFAARLVTLDQRELPFDTLSPRELAQIEPASYGYEIGQIATAGYRSGTTIKTQRSTMSKKLLLEGDFSDVHPMRHIVYSALKAEVITVPDEVDEVQERSLEALESLTEYEAWHYRFRALGLTNEVTAHGMLCGATTVRHHLASIREKLKDVVGTSHFVAFTRFGYGTGFFITKAQEQARLDQKSTEPELRTINL